MQNLLQMTPTPDGVFCYNDPVAIGAMKAAATLASTSLAILHHRRR